MFEEFLCTEVGAETGFCDHIISKDKPILVASMVLVPLCNIGERSPWMMAGLPSSVCTRLGF